MLDTNIQLDTPPVETPAESIDNVDTTTVEQETTETVDTSTDTPTIPDGGATTDDVYEIDGEKLTKEQIRELKKKYGRDSGWIQKNEERGRLLNEREKEVAELHFLKQIIDQRPDLRAQILNPPPQRNFDTEFQGLLSQEPELYTQEHKVWEYDKDNLLLERATHNARQVVEQEKNRELAEKANLELINYGKEKYLDTGKLNDTEYATMIQWISQNVASKNGMFDKKSVDVAYKTLYEDRWIADIKLDQAKSIANQINKAKPSNASTVIVTNPRQEDLDDKEKSFVEYRKLKRKLEGT